MLVHVVRLFRFAPMMASPQLYSTCAVLLAPGMVHPLPPALSQFTARVLYATFESTNVMGLMPQFNTNGTASANPGAKADAIPRASSAQRLAAGRWGP
ncbi:hypothetical protein THSYN_27760 [Candidatus Thiodictyon syntrophicum]|uniref:Uncharacterized protein n=1 Tax=Candidatus Thiodictyon syntrophicum TaxID=1166950 RepID=A0A2K8UFL7_9GAMM|nr:hypothetical protein THSYN_27760 [Candidatus Thiodictyon syntrophicum]